MQIKKRKVGSDSPREAAREEHSVEDHFNALPEFKTPEESQRSYVLDNAYIFSQLAKQASSVDQAYEWAKEAYEINREYAYEYAMACFDAELYEDAFDLLGEASEQPDVRAYAQIGRFYEFGYGSLEADYSSALQYYQKSHDAGESQGTYELGRCLEEGKFVDENMALATQYYHNAALRSNTDAIMGLVRLYSEGKIANANNIDALCLLYSAFCRRLIDLDNQKFCELRNVISNIDFNSYADSVDPDSLNSLRRLLQRLRFDAITENENLFEYLSNCSVCLGQNLPFVTSCSDLIQRSLSCFESYASLVSRS